MRPIHRSILAALLLAACGGDDGGGADAAPVATVTWHQDIAPLVTEHCSTCHVSGGIGPISFEEYAGAAAFAPLMLARVRAGDMPPWGAAAADDCEPRLGWQDDPRLTAEEIQLLETWVNENVPLGDPDNPAPLPEPPELDLADPTHTVTPDVTFGPAGDGDTDQFVCFVLDPGIADPAWVTGLQLVPADRTLVHHAVIYAVPPDGQDELAALAPDGYFDCFGGVEAPGTSFLGVWVPGTPAFEAPDGVGIPFIADSKLVVQLHYHLHYDPGGMVFPPERSQLRLRVTESQPSKQLILLELGNADAEPLLLPGPNDSGGAVEFRVPAGIADHTETMRFPIDLGTAERAPLVMISPHMHYVGVDLQATISRGAPVEGEPDEECLLKVPHWNFKWHRTYQYDADLAELPTVGTGDEITLRCLYDNTLENEFVDTALNLRGLQQPIDVFLGEETLDEMCMASFGLLVD